MPNLPVAMDAWGRSACYPQSTFYLMSDGPSTWNRRITKPCFHTCSTYWSRSQASLYLYALRVIADHPEEAFGLLRYLLGGDRPSQTAHKTLSPDRIHGPGLDSPHNKSGISLMAPQRLAPLLQRLPLMLHMLGRKPISCYSKGSWGLSVPLRENGIFTATTVSPSLSLRQCSSCYTIRAGRNLPDKEFRYHRTLIVRAAVYRSLNSELLTEVITLPLDLPAPGTCHSVYFGFWPSHRAVFLVNSHLSRFTAAFRGCAREGLDQGRRPLSRSYGSNLPSSLTRVLSRACGFSPHPPVSVYGTGTPELITEFFLAKSDSFLSAKAFARILRPEGPTIRGGPASGFHKHSSLRCL